jgi:hypothetical protein
MKDEVEEFLRRVAQLRQQAEAQNRGQPSRPAPVPRPSPPPPTLVQAPPARLVPVPEPVSYPQPIQAEVVDAELAESGDRVGRRVAQDMRGTEEIADHTRRLGEEVNLADDKMEAHLHQVFDHRLGRLKESTAAESPSAPGESDDGLMSLLKLLREPRSIRDAILMGEILRRPEERW